jgi:anti-sigma regulatory factor (Ser/Thr protein kinase)
MRASASIPTIGVRSPPDSQETHPVPTDTATHEVMRPPDTQLLVQLPARREAAAAARRALGSLNGPLELLDAGVLADLRLLVTELIANAVRHSGIDERSPVTVEVTVASAHVRVEVVDEGEGFDPAAVPGPSGDERGGLGLFMVARLADRWGVARDGGTRVWFEIDLRDSTGG